MLPTQYCQINVYRIILVMITENSCNCSEINCLGFALVIDNSIFLVLGPEPAERKHDPAFLTLLELRFSKLAYSFMSRP